MRSKLRRCSSEAVRLVVQVLSLVINILDYLQD
jgi:hypothetical protein